MNEVVAGRFAKFKAMLDEYNAGVTVVAVWALLMVLGGIYTVSHEVLVVNRGSLDQAQVSANLARVGEVALVQPAAPAEPAKAEAAPAAETTEAEAAPAAEPAEAEAAPAAESAEAEAAPAAEPAKAEAAPAQAAPIARPMPAWMRHMAPLN